MPGSPADAISRAVERSQRLLFPFNANKWFALGFTVFLAQCGESGGSSFPNIPGGSSPTPRPGGSSGGGTGGSWAADLQQMFADAWAFLNRDLALYVTLAAVSAALILGLWVLVVWLSSRAKLMFVESVIWDRVDVATQWTRAGDLGMSLCKCRLLLGFCGWMLILGGTVAGVVAALPDFQSGQFFGPRALIGYGILLGTSVVFGLPLTIALAILDDFVVPLMVVRNARVREAWSMCSAEVLSGNVGGVIVFYLLRIGLAFAIGIAVMIVSCLTCCLTAIPYIGTVILLPVFVFSRAYPLCYLETLGVSVFPVAEPSWAIHEEWRFPK